MSDKDLQTDEGFVAVYDAKNETTADIVKAALESEGIPAVVRPLHTSWFDGIFVAAEGRWGQVLVPVVDVQRAEAFLAEYGEIE